MQKLVSVSLRGLLKYSNRSHFLPVRNIAYASPIIQNIYNQHFFLSTEAKATGKENKKSEKQQKDNEKKQKQNQEKKQDQKKGQKPDQSKNQKNDQHKDKKQEQVKDAKKIQNQKQEANPKVIKKIPKVKNIPEVKVGNKVLKGESAEVRQKVEEARNAVKIEREKVVEEHKEEAEKLQTKPPNIIKDPVLKVDKLGKQEFPKNVVEIVDKIIALNMIEQKLLADCMSEKLGLPSVATMFSGGFPGFAAGGGGGVGGGNGGAAGGGAGGETKEKPKEEKTSFKVVLKAFPAASKIKVIKEVRTILGLGLRESKTLVESAPATLKDNLNKKEAEDMVKKIKEAGADVVME